MPRIIETKHFHIRWGQEIAHSGNDTSSSGMVHPNYIVFNSEIRKAIDKLDEEAWEVKSVTPIIEAIYSTQILQNVHSRGFAQSTTHAGAEAYSSSYTSGVLILAQRWLDLSEEEVAAKKAEKAAVKEQQKAIAGEEAYSRVMNMPIEKVGSLMSATFHFDGKVYRIKEAAESHRRKKAEEARKAATDW